MSRDLKFRRFNQQEIPLKDGEKGWYKMSNKKLQRWFNGLSLDDRLQVQKFVIVLYYIGDTK